MARTIRITNKSTGKVTILTLPKPKPGEKANTLDLEEGDIFDEDGREDCIELMHKVAPLIDKLTYEYLNLGH